MSQLPRPDWYSKPPEEWPDSAREFYRLCWVITRRIQEQRARDQAARSQLASQRGDRGTDIL